MALDMAIYSSSQTCIYGVRGQWVYKFNATTGAKISEFRFVKDVIFAESYIVEVAGNLYISTWRNALESDSVQNAPYQDIWRVNYALNSSVALGLNSLAVFNSYQFAALFSSGFANLVTDGTYIYGRYGVEARYIFKLNPAIASPYGAAKLSWTVSRNKHVNDLASDTVNGVIWSTGTDVSKVAASLNTISGGGQRSSDTVIDTTLGCCVVPGSPPQVYFVTGGQDVYGVDVASAYDAFPPTTFNAYNATSFSLPDSDTQPMRIKYNAYDGKIYVPGWVNDKVYVYTPSVGYPTAPALSSTFTGFTAPHDCVFTPSKKWAVQNSSTGLREII